MNEFQSFPFFKGIKIKHLSLLIKCASHVDYHAGETLFTQGAAAFRLFLIKSGSVSLDGVDGASGKSIRQIAIAGDVLAHSWLEVPANWPLTARAIERTSVIVLSGARLMTCAEEHPEFGAELAKRGLKSGIDAFPPCEASIAQNDRPSHWPAFQFDGSTETVSSGRIAFARGDRVDISLASAKKFSLHDGERVQIVTPHGKAVVPVHITTQVESIG